MTFEQYWTILVKQFKLILICFVTVGLGTLIGSKLMTPMYQSSVLIQVDIRSSNNNQSDYNNLLASDQLVQTEAALATSNSVLSAVASHYHDLSAEQLAKDVSTTTKLNTQLFEIDVVNPNAAMAARLANDIATTMINQQLQVIQQNNTQAQQQIHQDLDQTREQINNTTAKISALQAKGGNSGQLALLQAQLSGLQQHYSQWQAALAQLELTQAQSGNFLRVAQSAQPGTSPVRPNVPLYTAGGLLVGLLLGILLAVVFEQLDTRVRTPDALTQLLEWPVLSTVWRANSSKGETVLNPTGRDANAESYRILRTNIGFSSIDKPLRSMVVTSMMPGDGKSTVAANLAIFMAKAGKTTLLIDADLHRPTQHTLFGLSPEKLGLSNALLTLSMPGASQAPAHHQFLPRNSSVPSPSSPGTNSLSLEPFIHGVGIPNLGVMPSGPLPPNPSELLESKAMQRFLVVLANCGAEVVIFDAPPLLGLSDSSILASKVDGAVMVIDTSRATKGKLKQAKAILAQTGVNILGCVANKQRHNRSDPSYSYYYYYRSEEQNGDEKQTGNGHAPTTPVTSLPSAAPVPSEQGAR